MTAPAPATAQAPLLLQPLFDAHTNPAFASSDSMREQLPAILQAVGALQKQVIEWRQAVVAIEMTPEGAAVRGQLEVFNTRLAALESQCAQLLSGGRLAVATLDEIDGIVAKMKTNGPDIRAIRLSSSAPAPTDTAQGSGASTVAEPPANPTPAQSATPT